MMSHAVSHAPMIRAEFSDGATVTLWTSKPYNYAWRVCWRRAVNSRGKPVDVWGREMASDRGIENGFALTKGLADRAMRECVERKRQDGRPILLNEVKPVDRLELKRFQEGER